MSFDLVVYNAASAPQDEAGFNQWYRQQMASPPGPAIPPLQAWQRDMEDRSGPFSGNGTPEMVYASFSREMATDAFHMAFELAGQHVLGLFDPQAGTRWLPRDGGGMYQYSDGGDDGEESDAFTVAETLLLALCESGDLEPDEDGDGRDLLVKITKVLDRARHRSAVPDLWKLFMSHDAVGELYLDKDELKLQLDQASEAVRGHPPTSSTGWV
jgi:hypothetical protein